MALQKKKRNFILKYNWKKIQLKKLKKTNYNVFFKKFRCFLLLKKNIKKLNFKKFTNIYDVFNYNKYATLSLFKTLNVYNIYYNENKIIRFNAHFNNSNTLIIFLINFHDNIIRDRTTILYKKVSIYNKTLSLFTDKNISIILWKIKKILKYFFIFIDYFGINLHNYYLLFYNYFKFFYVRSATNSINFINFFKIFNKLFSIKKKFNLKYLLFYKNINNNILINYLVKKDLGIYIFKKYKLKKKQLYLSNLKKLSYYYRNILIKMNFYNKFKYFRYCDGRNKFFNIFFYINFLKLNLYTLQRQFLYLNFFINKLYIYKNFNNKKNLKLSFILYRKDFNFFDNKVYSNLYNRIHIKNWYYNIINFFNFNVLNNSDIKTIKSKFLIYQNYYFNNLNWSCHIVFKKNNYVKNFIDYKFFNFNNIKYNFLYFFFKINKLRNTLDYLIFFLLPINLNLIWVEYSSLTKSKFKSTVFNCLKSEIKSSDWFLEQGFFLNKTKKYIKSYFNKKTTDILNKKYNRYLYLLDSKFFKLLRKKKKNLIQTRWFLYKFKNLYKLNANILFNINKNNMLFYNHNYKNYLNRLSNFNINYSLYYRKKISYLISKINKKKFLNNYKSITNTSKNSSYKNFLIKHIFSFNKLKIRNVTIKSKNYSSRYSSLNNFISNSYSIQRYLYKKINKKFLFMQNVLLYHNTKKENIFSSVIHIYLKELTFRNIDIFLLYKKNYLINLNIKKINIFGNYYNNINSLFIWFYLLQLFIKSNNSAFLLYKYIIYYYIFCTKIFISFKYIF